MINLLPFELRQYAGLLLIPAAITLFASVLAFASQNASEKSSIATGLISAAVGSTIGGVIILLVIFADISGWAILIAPAYIVAGAAFSAGTGLIIGIIGKGVRSVAQTSQEGEDAPHK